MGLEWHSNHKFLSGGSGQDSSRSNIWPSWPGTTQAACHPKKSGAKMAAKQTKQQPEMQSKAPKEAYLLLSTGMYVAATDDSWLNVPLHSYTPF
jgi:hypothetical protein